MNYNDLVAASIAYADRNDIEVNQNIDVFILMAEARMNRLLKTREQSGRFYTPTVEDQEYYVLPDDFLGVRDIQLNTTSDPSTAKTKQLHYLSPEQMNARDDAPFNGTHYYTIIANQFQIYPKQAAGKTIEIVYFQKVPNLNEINNTNWMSESHPDIYLASMVAEIEIFAKNYDIATGWEDRLSTAINELATTDTIERWSGGALQMRIG